MIYRVEGSRSGCTIVNADTWETKDGWLIAIRVMDDGLEQEVARFHDSDVISVQETVDANPH